MTEHFILLEDLLEYLNALETVHEIASDPGSLLFRDAAEEYVPGAGEWVNRLLEACIVVDEVRKKVEKEEP